MGNTWFGAIRIALIFIAVLTLSTGSEARIQRDKKALREFVKQHACPSTGRHRLPCPGWVIDHVDPLCAGGSDRPENMQWQTVQDAKLKDREERRQCSNSPRYGAMPSGMKP